MPRVAVLTPNGEFGTIDEKDVANLPEGARVLSQKDVETRDAEARQAEREEKAGVGGKIATVAGAISGAINPLAYQGGPGSSGESYNRGVTRGLTAGLSEVAERKVIDATAGHGEGAKYAQSIDDSRTADPFASGAGEFMGFAAQTASMPGIGTAGNLAERGAAAAFKGLASRGAIGRAIATGAKLGVRGAVETGIYGGAEYAANQELHDQEIDGQKLFSTVGHSALNGGAIGFGLGAGGSLLATGARAARSSIVKSLAKGDAVAGEPYRYETDATTGRVTAHAKGGLELPAIDADAGLREPAPAAESPIRFGSAEQPIGIRPQGGARRAPSAEGPISIGKSISIDPDAGIAARESSGKFQGKLPTADALQFRKDLPRSTSLDLGGELAPVEAQSPIRMPEASPGSLTGARGMAADQAWKAVGAGFGLQTTRYAKQAAKYFGPNGTRELGDIAIRHGAFDIDPNASALEAAWTAAKTGTPDKIAPKLATATDSVGKQIGEITEASGARISTREIRDAVEDVARELDRKAGYRDRARAVRGYGEELLDVLGANRREQIPVQEVLEQRRHLDDLVFAETKTLDPKGRVANLRDVRAGLERTITDSLDRASGQVPGELASKYKALKRDYHGLRILTEAAEDSAARASKGATFGLGEKMTLAAGLATGLMSGHPLTALGAPALALGQKLVRERGNAAAAGALTRLADAGAMRAALREADLEAARSAKAVLAEPTPPKLAPKKTTRAAKEAADTGREEAQAMRAQGEQIAKWVGDVQANPKRFMDELADRSAELGRAAGPKATAAYAQAAVKAFAFIAKYVPARDRRDPLDPRSVPPLTFEEAERLVRVAKYGTQPRSVFADFGRGVVTTEGIEAAKAFMPERFAEFQEQLFAHVTDHMMRNRQLTQTQRLRVDRLLDGQAIPAAEVSRLQANLAGPLPEAPSAPMSKGNKAVDMQFTQSGFDAVEARKSQ